MKMFTVMLTSDSWLFSFSILKVLVSTPILSGKVNEIFSKPREIPEDKIVKDHYTLLIYDILHTIIVPNANN